MLTIARGLYYNPLAEWGSPESPLASYAEDRWFKSSLRNDMRKHGLAAESRRRLVNEELLASRLAFREHRWRRRAAITVDIRGAAMRMNREDSLFWFIVTNSSKPAPPLTFEQLKANVEAIRRIYTGRIYPGGT